MYQTDENDDADSRAAEHIKALLGQYTDTPVLFLASGGSAHAVIEKLSDVGAPPKDLTLSVVDERYTEYAADRNFPTFASSKFFLRCIDTGATAYDPYTASLSLTETASTFSEQLSMWRKANRDGVVIALLGVGSDAHIAGVLPMPDNAEQFATLFVDTPQAAVGYEVSPDIHVHAKRITTTLAFLREVHHAIVYVAQAGKQDALAKLAAESGSLAEAPARILRELPEAHVHLKTT